MSDDQKQDPAETTSAEPVDTPNQADGVPELPEEWKPEPREWTWKDVFTAPMLAFKPKCMLISVLTIILLGFFAWGWGKLMGAIGDIALVTDALGWIGILIAAVIFGLGASMVSIFFKADLMDDEFLSMKEAMGHFGKRCKAAVMVPAFLVLVVAGFNLLIYIAELIGSVPFLGSFLYGLLQPLGFLLSLLTVLLTIGVLLSIFVGPAVIAIRRHGWFDNVIDTFEAVGTKPHVLVWNGAITLLMVAVCYFVPTTAMTHMASFGWGGNLPTNEIARTELGAQKIKEDVLPVIFRPELLPAGVDFGTAQIKRGSEAALAQSKMSELEALNEELQELWDEKAKKVSNEEKEAISQEIDALNEDIKAISEGDGTTGYHNWVSGLLAAIWQLLIIAGVTGYLLNVFLSGGMLTYLAVREDDYWDDEDLEDLDKLAKELEEEAKREEEAVKADKPTESEAAKADKKDEGEDKPAEEDKSAETQDTGDQGDKDEGEDKPADEDESAETEEAADAEDKGSAESDDSDNKQDDEKKD